MNNSLWNIILIMICFTSGLIFFLYKIKFSEMMGDLIDPKYQGNRILLIIITAVVWIDIILLALLLCLITNRLL